MGDEKQKHKETTTIELSLDSLLNGLGDLVEKGNKRRFILRNSKGEAIIDIPLTVGFVGGGFLLFMFPFWVFLAIGAAIFFRVRVEVARVNLEDESDVVEARVINADDDASVEKAAKRIARKGRRVSVDVPDTLSDSRLSDNGETKSARTPGDVDENAQLDDSL